MTKPFSINISRPRWRNLLLVRALLFTISIVLSSSAENVEPYDDTTERNLLAPQRLGQSSGAAAIIEPLLERELHSKSTKAAKSSKIGSKSGSSKGSKSKAAKSKSGKSKAAKSKSGKSVSAESKAAKSVSAKAAKSVSAKAAKSVSAKSKAEKGKSAKSLFQTKYLDDMELDTETENIPPVPEEKEENVATTQSSSSAESTSVYHDSMSSNGDSSAEEMEDIGNTRLDATATSSDGVEHDDGDVMSIESEDVIEPTNLQGDSMEENNNGNLDLEEDTQSSSSNFSPTDHSSEEEIEDTSNASTEVTTPSSDTVEYGNESEDNVDATSLKAELMEERIEESEAVEILDEKEAILDPSWETLG